MGKKEHMISAVSFCDIDSIALATALHKNIFSVKDLKKILISENYQVRHND